MLSVLRKRITTKANFRFINTLTEMGNIIRNSSGNLLPFLCHELASHIQIRALSRETPSEATQINDVNCMSEALRFFNQSKHLD